MNYGFQLAAHGAFTSLYRMDVLSNNLANMATPGFKADIPGVRQRATAKVEDRLTIPSNRLLERLGGGVHSAPNYVKFEQGTLRMTDNPLDVGIRGDGFFALRDDAASEIRLTRDGRFTMNESGRLVSATTGLPVLGEGDSPITLATDAQVLINADGTISQNGEVVGRIQVCQVPDTSRLLKYGDGMFSAPPDALASRRPGTGRVEQGHVEDSAVDPMAALLALTDASRSAESNYSLIQGHDRLIDRAINGLGRTV